MPQYRQFSALNSPLRIFSPYAAAAVIAWCACGPISAAEAIQADAAKPAPGSAAPAAAPRPDPTAAIVAEGHFIYRQRDLDALMLIAQRHCKGKLSKPDEERLRQVLLRSLTARESLLDVLGGLPPSITGKAREGALLDLLDYQAEPATATTLPPAAPTAGAPTPLPSGTPITATPSAPAAAAATIDNGPVLVRLPMLNLTRTLDGLGKRQLSMGLALYFRDPVLARTLEAKAPLIQDAILGFVQRLPAAQFAEPDQLTLKDGLTKAVIGKVPEFPVDGILIPQLESNPPDAPAGAAEPAR